MHRTFAITPVLQADGLGTYLAPAHSRYSAGIPRQATAASVAQRNGRLAARRLHAVAGPAVQGGDLR
jgi:hypothetical protein